MTNGKDFKLYFKYGQMHKNLFADKILAEQYQLKARTIVNISRIQMCNNTTRIFSDLDYGVLITSANKSNTGKIEFCNQVLLRKLGFAICDLKYNSLEILQPN